MVDCANSHASITCTDVHFLYFTNFLIPLENYWFFREKNVFFEFGNFLKFTAIKLREKNLEKKSFPTHLRISGSSPGRLRVYRVGFSGSITRSSLSDDLRNNKPVDTVSSLRRLRSDPPIRDSPQIWPHECPTTRMLHEFPTKHRIQVYE
jgi:hypothetical protein